VKDDFEKFRKHLFWQMFALGVITGLLLASIIAGVMLISVKCI